MKGKHAASSTARRLKEAEESLRQMNFDLAEAKKELHSLRGERKRADGLQELCSNLEQQIKDGTGDEVKRLELLTSEQQTKLRKVTEELHNTQDAYERYIEKTLPEGLTGIERIERISEIIGRPFTMSHGVAKSKGLGEDAVKRIQRARGQRK